MPIAACAAITLLSLWNAASYWRLTRTLAVPRDPYGIAARHDRFAAMAAVLRSGKNGSPKKLDFITNRPDPEIRNLLSFSAAYELAPGFVLMDGIPSSELVVGSFEEPVDPRLIAQANGLEVVEDFGGGIVLFRRVPRARKTG